MSWWISLEDADGPVEVPEFTEGGTYRVGGSSVADINVTYNYGSLFGFGALDGMKASDTAGLLAAKVVEFGTDRDDDYWKPTPGNVGVTLAVLLGWALRHPDATWRVT